MMTNWLPVLNYEQYYQVSDTGEVKSLDRVTTGRDGRTISHRGRVLVKSTDRAGYQIVSLCVQGKVKYRKVHQLVLESFVGPCPDGMESCHDDGNNSNNNVDNLRWDTKSNNNLDRVKHGTHQEAGKIECKYGHKLKSPNLRLAINGKANWRGQCLACSRAHSHISSNKRRGYEIPDFQSLADRKYQQIMRLND